MSASEVSCAHVEAGAGAGATPSLTRRLACFVYEGMLMFGMLLVPGALGALFFALTGQRHPLQSESALRVIAFVMFGIYFTWFWSARGQTLPMQTWRLRVVTADGGPLTQPRAMLRYLASCAWFAPAAALTWANGWTGWHGLGAIAIGIVAYALLALLHPQRQFWHDALCGTRLVDAADADRQLPRS